MENTVTCKYIPDENSLQRFCSPFYFTCPSLRNCIPYGKVCNGYVDCLYAEDEICQNLISKKVKNVIYTLPISTFTCTRSNTVIASFLVDDLIPDCPDSIEDELQYFNLVTDPFHIQQTCNSGQELACLPGHSHCFPMDKLCIFEFQYNTTILRHCRNGAHLYNCTHHQCSEHFKCQMSYCIPFELICDGKWDCPQGDDKINCPLFSCPNLFKCKNQTKCLHLSKICNNKNECQFGDDELWCINDSLLICPEKCKCFSQSIICNNLDKVLYHHIWITIKYFKCFSCNILHNSSNHFSIFQSIIFLNIKNYLFSSSCITKDNNISIIFSLKHLDISFNRLTTTRRFCFFSLKNLTIFYLQHNLISNFEENSFYLLFSLQLLDLSRNKIKTLKSSMFNGLPNIKTINLTLNLIMDVHSGTFKDVCPYSVHSYNVKVCCMSGSWNKCKVKNDAFSNCDNLLSDKYQRYLCWLIAILAFSFNIISFLHHNKNFKSQRNTFPIRYLALVDWCFGIYLLIIASADLYYKGNYVGYELVWKGYFTCKVAAFIALTSMIVSAMILCLMMLARYCVIQWPMTSKYKNKTYVKRLVEVFLIVGVCLCIIFNFWYIWYSRKRFANRDMPSCLYFQESVTPFFSDLFRSNSCTDMLLLSNFESCLFTINCFKENMEHTTDLQNKNVKSVKVAKQLSLVIVTNMCCWIPSNIVLILALAGYHVSSHYLSWVTLIIIPINSVLDPLFLQF